MRSETANHSPSRHGHRAVLAFLIASPSMSRAATLEPSASPTIGATPVVGGLDEHGCGGGTGTSWCPELEECIYSWMEACPIDGDTFAGPTKLLCAKGRCSSEEKCEWTEADGASFQTYYWPEETGELIIPDGCNANCTGCELAPEDDGPSLIGAPDEHGCGGGTGTSWCPELEKCIRPWMEPCPIEGDSFAGPTELVCEEGRCSSDEKCEWTEGSATLATYYFDDVTGDFDVPDGCNVNCTGCEHAPDKPSLIGAPDEHGCGGGTGTSWCPELEECIRPWEETCPIDGVAFAGPTKLVCEEGRCSSDEECEWTEGSATFATYYWTDLTGDFDVPDGCNVTCTGCENETAAQTDDTPPPKTLSDSSSAKLLRAKVALAVLQLQFITVYFFA